MFEIYLASLIFGGALLAASLLFGGEHDSGADPGGSSDLHVGDSHPAIIEGQDIELHHQESSFSEAAKFFSFRNLIYFTAFFGLTGTSLSLMSLSLLFSLPASIVIGGLASFSGYKFMRYLQSSQSGEGQDLSSFIGKTGIVMVNLHKDSYGKISVEFGGKSEQFIAKVSDIAKQEEFLPGEQVLIIETKNNKMYVVETDLTN